MTAKRKRRILFVGEAVSLAHVVRPLVLARSLDTEQFDLYFACADRYQELLSTAGIKRRPLESISSERFLKALANGSPIYDRETLERYVEDDLCLLDKVQPELVVGDFRLSLAVSAPRSKVPYLALANAHWSPYSTMPFPLPELPVTHALGLLARVFGLRLATAAFRWSKPAYFAIHARPLSALRRRYGLPAFKSLLDVHTNGDYTLYSDIPSIAPTRGLPANHRYLGPILWAPAICQPPWWQELDDSKPIIYLTLGSSGQIDALPPLIEALADLPFQVLLATAGREHGLTLASNIWAADYLPGDKAVGRAEFVICNGGSATVYQALAGGVPVLGIPSNLDQFLTMSAVCSKGAGTLVRAGSAKPSTLRRAIVEFSKQLAGYQHQARLLAEEIAAFDARARFNSFLKQLLSGPADGQASKTWVP